MNTIGTEGGGAMACGTDFDAADLLAAITSDARTYVNVAGLAEQIGVDRRGLFDRLREMVVADLIAWWPHPEDGLGVCLSSRTAAALKLKPDANGHRWIPAGQARSPRKHQAATTVLECELDRPGEIVSLDEVADPAAIDPLKAAVANEAAAKLPAKRSRADYVPYTVPRPRVLLGSSSIWPVRPRRDGTCGVCGGRRLPPVWYCLLCDNFGCQHLLPPPDRQVRRRRHERAGLKGGKG